MKNNISKYGVSKDKPLYLREITIMVKEREQQTMYNF